MAVRRSPGSPDHRPNTTQLVPEISHPFDRHQARTAACALGSVSRGPTCSVVATRPSGVAVVSMPLTPPGGSTHSTPTSTGTARGARDALGALLGVLYT